MGWFGALALGSDCALSKAFVVFVFVCRFPIAGGGVLMVGGETKAGESEPPIGREMTEELKCDSTTVSLISEALTPA